MKKLILLILLITPIKVVASEILNDSCTVKINNQSYTKLEDNNYKTFVSFDADALMEINCEEEIKDIYIMYNVKNSTGTLEYNNQKASIGTNGYLNELIKLENSTKNLTINYNAESSIAEIYIFNEKIPNWVQDWQTLKKADLMLFSTHSDDEQLFFAGLMPTYINEGYKIQVVYFTNHYNNTFRYQEQLDGLWTIGIRYYPVISTFPDAYSTSLEGAIKNLNSSGYTREDAIEFQVDQIRKYRPFVVVGHDEKGEYSHGQHILNTDALKEAIFKANDSDYQSNGEYKPWLISKLYLHLYSQNQIILNYDIPLKHYEGKSAYEVSKEGYSKHYSQQYTWFTEWLNGPNNTFTSATQIKTYNPAHYGLYYTSVGEDINKNNMFENIYIPLPDILFNENDNNPIYQFINTLNGLSANQKNMYIGLSIIFISVIGIIIIHNRRS